MSLVFFTGFDADPGQLEGGTYQVPAAGAGMNSVRNTGRMGYTFSESATYRIGVTGRDQDTIGTGRQKRNRVVLFRLGAQHRPYLQTPSLGAFDGVSDKQCVLGFNFCIDPLSVMPIAQGAAATNTALIAVDDNPIVTISPTRQLVLRGTNTNVTVNVGQTYYIELVAKTIVIPQATSWFITYELYVDDVLVGTGIGPTKTVGLTTSFVVQVGTWLHSSAISAGNVNQQRWLFSDFYGTDSNGSAPFNGRLGPQMVLPVDITTVDATTWTRTGGTDAKDVLAGSNKDNDATFLSAPASADPVKVRFDAPSDLISIVNGFQVFARAKRDAGTIRTLSGLLKDSDDAALPGNRTVSPDTTISDFIPLAWLPNSAAAADRLKDSVLDTAELQLTASV